MLVMEKRGTPAIDRGTERGSLLKRNRPRCTLDTGGQQHGTGSYPSVARAQYTGDTLYACSSRHNTPAKDGVEGPPFVPPIVRDCTRHTTPPLIIAHASTKEGRYNQL